MDPPTKYNIDFALVDGRLEIRMQKESYELGVLISKLQLGDDEMSIETYIQMKGEDTIELELSTHELVDVALETNYAQDFDLNIDLDSLDMDDVAPPTKRLSDTKHHASLLSSFLLENSYILMLKKIIVSES